MQIGRYTQERRQRGELCSSCVRCVGTIHFGDFTLFLAINAFANFIPIIYLPAFINTPVYHILSYLVRLLRHHVATETMKYTPPSLIVQRFRARFLSTFAGPPQGYRSVSCPPLTPPVASLHPAGSRVGINDAFYKS